MLEIEGVANKVVRLRCTHGCAEKEYYPGVAEVVQRLDVNGDGHEDLLLQLGELVDGELMSFCGNWGDCVQGVFASCGDNAFVELVAADYSGGLSFADTKTSFGGHSWRDIVEDERVSGGDAEAEAELLERGEEPVVQRRWRRGPGGYQRH